MDGPPEWPPFLHDSPPQRSWLLEQCRRGAAAPPTALLFFAFIGQSMILSRVVLSRTCHSMFDSPCDALPPVFLARASASAGWLSGWITSASSILSIVSTSWLGAASDVVGRRPVLLLSTLCLFLSCTGTFLVLLLNWSLNWLIVFATVAGLGGSFSTWIAAAMAMTADVSGEQRSLWFAVVESSIYLGCATGPLALAAVLDHLHWSDSAPFALAALVYVVIGLYVIILLPESVAGARLSHIRHVSWLRTYKATLLMLLPSCRRQSDSTTSRQQAAPRTAPWLMIFVLFYGCDTEAGLLLPLLTSLGNTSAINMEASTFGLLMTVQNLAKWLFLAALMPALLRLLGTELAPPLAFRTCLLVQAVCTSLYALAPSPAALFGLVSLQAIGPVAMPLVRAMLSAAFAPAESGRVLGTISILEALVVLAVPPVGAQLWAATVDASRVPLSYVTLGGRQALAVAASCLLRWLPKVSV